MRVGLAAFEKVLIDGAKAKFFAEVRGNILDHRHIAARADH